MIFNINSTRGHTGSLLVFTKVEHCGLWAGQINHDKIYEPGKTWS